MRTVKQKNTHFENFLKKFMSRLKQLISALGMTQVEFAEKMGIAKSTVSDVISGRLKDLPNHVHTTLVRGYSVNLNWLLTGEGEMFLMSSQNDSGVSIQNNSGVNIVGNNATVNYHPKMISDEEYELLQEIRKSKKKNMLQKIMDLLKILLLATAIYAVYEAVREMPGLEGSEPRAEVQAGGKV